ncbi:AgmX/PglI C-terminal domain-containing protein [Nannocystis sp. SCPEA4]|uniref:AgmX/PglI C-terminal domain-containing protein n=1 Tax=Nannocystis sp. SCPEA4 TaxID=2996787 RepID=UPI002271E61F|nr:AgmX/PglI C-terminal domain-containing protein [Nannocystis sp. SCPEA4]MCY1062604.1 AgmX/PglI C-terminal domain-containing protein [Nannocystis sp. SCPEA4]
MWIEVVTTYGRTTLDVVHLRPAPRRRGALALGLGALVFAGGLGLFASEVRQDWSGYAAAVAAAQLRGEVRPPAPGLGTGGLGGALALLGLVPLVVGLSRLRERPSQRLPGLPRAATPRFVAGATGPWMFTTAGCRRVPTSGCTLTHGPVTLEIRAVQPETTTIARGGLDLPLRSIATAGLGLIGFEAVLLHMSQEALSIRQVDLGPDDERYVGRVVRATLPAREQAASPGDDTDVGGMSGETGVSAGRAVRQPRLGGLARGPASTVPALGRGHDPAQAARSAGVLGLMQASGFVGAGEAYAGADGDADVWGGAGGSQVGEIGLGGLGLVGTGRGGPLSGEGAGLDVVGLIGKGCGCGVEANSWQSRSGVAFGGRGTRVPTVRPGSGEAQGALDRDIIRRIVRAHLAEVRHCYNQTLARDPEAKGRVSVQFVIGGGGQVTSAAAIDSDVRDQALSACVAQAVRRWKFPRAEGAGSTAVTYPFVFTPA